MDLPVLSLNSPTQRVWEREIIFLFSRERKSTIPASIIVDDPERKESIDDFEIAATQSWSANQCHMDVFVRKFKRAWDDICTLYVDMYLDKHPISKVAFREVLRAKSDPRQLHNPVRAQYTHVNHPNRVVLQADEMSKSLLVFLVAEPEELPTLRREKPLHELLREKLREKQQRDADAAAAAGAAHGPYAMSAVAVQSESCVPNCQMFSCFLICSCMRDINCSLQFDTRESRVANNKPAVHKSAHL